MPSSAPPANGTAGSDHINVTASGTVVTVSGLPSIMARPAIC